MEMQEEAASAATQTELDRLINIARMARENRTSKSQNQEAATYFDAILASYVGSIFWAAVAVSLVIFMIMSIDIVMVDFLNVNPYRSRFNAASTPILEAPIVLIITVSGLYLVFTFSQGVQAIICYLSIRHNSRAVVPYVLAATLPLTSIISWYCYDYLTPSNIGLGFNEGSDWMPYKHGLTVSRYFSMFAQQFGLTAFSVVRWKLEIDHNKAGKRILFLTVFGLATVVGTAMGMC